jgi:hypothetical protein
MYHKVVSRKTDNIVWPTKKTNFDVKNKTLWYLFCLFYTDYLKYRFFAKLYECTWIMEIYMQKFSFGFFDT